MFLNRKFTRHPLQLQVQLFLGGKWTDFTTVDISRPGMFVRVLNPTQRLGQVIQARLQLPDRSTFEPMARVRRVVTGSENRPGGAGLGLEWFAISRENKDTWDRLVLGMRQPAQDRTYAENSQVLRDQLPPLEVREMLRKMREAGELVGVPRLPPNPESLPPMVLPVQPATQERLALVAQRCASVAHLFLRTGNVPVLGQRVHVVLVHPDTDAEFVVRAVVDRIVHGDDGTYAGVQVKFNPLSEHEQLDLSNFVAGMEPTA